MAIMLVIMAFLMIMVGVLVQVYHNDPSVRMTVSWSVLGAAFCFLLFAGKVYSS